MCHRHPSPWHLSRGTRATAGGIRTASGARSCPPPAPSPLTMCAAREQAIYAAGAPAGQVGRGDSPVWQLEEELSHAARGIGEKRESLRQFESEEASSRLLGQRATSRRASSRCRPALASCCAHRRSGARRVRAVGQFGGCAVGLAPTPLWSRPAAWFPSFSMAFVCVLGSLGASAGARRRCRVVYRSQTHQINSMHLLNTRPPRKEPTRTQATERPQWAPAATRHRDEVVRGRRWRAAPLRRGDSRDHRCASILPGRRRRSGTWGRPRRRRLDNERGLARRG